VKNSRALTLLSGIALAALSSVAIAAMPVPFGWYIEGNVGEAKPLHKYYPGTIKNTHEIGFNFNGGYKFNPFVSGEVGYTNYGATRIDNSFGNQAAKDCRIAFDIAAKLSLPIWGTGAEIFGKLGAGRLMTDLNTNDYNATVNNLQFNTGTHSATGLYAGAGADYSITTHILVNAQWALARGNGRTGDLNLYSGGLSYIF
jgi:opacity protein-like surface antigen